MAENPAGQDEVLVTSTAAGTHGSQGVLSDDEHMLGTRPTGSIICLCHQPYIGLAAQLLEMDWRSTTAPRSCLYAI